MTPEILAAEPQEEKDAPQPASLSVDVLSLKRWQRPWRRLPDETALEYFAFQKYLELGPDRTLEATSEIFPRGKRQLSHYSGKHNWVARASAYDDYIAAMTEKKYEEALVRRIEENAAIWAERVERLKENEYMMALQFMERACEMLDGALYEEMDISPEGDEHKTIIRKPAGWSQRDAVRFGEAASKLARLAAGEVTERTAFDFDPKKATDEQLRAVRDGQNPR